MILICSALGIEFSLGVNVSNESVSDNIYNNKYEITLFVYAITLVMKPFRSVLHCIGIYTLP